MAELSGPNQFAFRFGNDDGGEATYTFSAALNTDITADTSENILIRIGIENITGIGDATISGQLQYSRNGGAWTNVTAASSVVIASDTTNIADNANTTNRLSGSAGAFTTGKFDDVDGLTSDVLIAVGEFTELLYCIQIVEADVSQDDTIDLRVSDVDITGYAQVPRMTVNIPAPPAETPASAPFVWLGRKQQRIRHG